jgi:hypothetical protein
LPLLPTFAPETDDAADSDEVKVATVDDEETDNLSLAPTFAPEIDDAAGGDEANVATGDGEESENLMVCYALYL